MKQTIRLLEEKNVYMQKGETVSVLEKRLRDKGIIIMPITKPFEAFYYGRKEPTMIEMKNAMKCYQLLKKTKPIKD